MTGGTQAKPVTLPCTCANLRSASRAVTRLYNKELRQEEIEITQFTILMALDLTGEITQGDLAQLLELDSTTLTRALEVLRTRQWVNFAEGLDRRHKLFKLSAAGKKKYKQALPHWERAQTQLKDALGSNAFGALTNLLMTTIAAAKP